MSIPMFVTLLLSGIFGRDCSSCAGGACLPEFSKNASNKPIVEIVVDNTILSFDGTKFSRTNVDNSIAPSVEFKSKPQINPNSQPQQNYSRPRLFSRLFR